MEPMTGWAKTTRLSGGDEMRGVILCFLWVSAATATFADVPQTINHQGVVSVNGTRFDSTGHFKFAIMNGSGVNVWTNDGSNLVLNGVPNTAEDIAVDEGIYSAILGGTGPGYTMTAIAAAVFNEPERKLRIWFDDGVNGFQQLTPDHSLTSSPYTHRSAQVDARYLFQANSSAAVDPPDGLSTIAFAEVIDPAGAYSADTTFTAPVAGFYFLSTNISFFNGLLDGTDGFDMEIAVNGVNRLWQTIGPNMVIHPGGVLVQSCSGVLQLSQGDNVTIRLNGVGSPIQYSTRSFSGFFLGS